MWKDYSWSYIKNNRASSISVMVAAFISALFLSLLCTLFYNFWKYDIERIEIEEGSWQARIEGELDNSVLDVVEKYPNIDKVIINKELSDGQNIVADLYFNDIRRILEDLPQIAELTGIDQEAITCHHSLLSMYLIRDPKDPAPRLVFPFFLAITGLACFSLIMIIHNSFAVSMNARIHQFGIFSSIGATPRQIRACLLQEAAALCAVPLLLGNVLGVLIGLGVMEMTNIIAGSDISGRHEAVGGYHPLVFVFTFAITILTVWISAWYPARKLSRLTPRRKGVRTANFLADTRLISATVNIVIANKRALADDIPDRLMPSVLSAWLFVVSITSISGCGTFRSGRFARSAATKAGPVSARRNRCWKMPGLYSAFARTAERV